MPLFLFFNHLAAEERESFWCHVTISVLWAGLWFLIVVFPGKTCETCGKYPNIYAIHF